MKARALAVMAACVLMMTACGKVEDNSSEKKKSPVANAIAADKEATADEDQSSDTDSDTDSDSDSDDDKQSDEKQQLAGQTELYIKGKQMEISVDDAVELVSDYLSREGLEDLVVELAFLDEQVEQTKENGIYLSIQFDGEQELTFGENTYKTKNITVFGSEEWGYWVECGLGGPVFPTDELIDSIYALAGLTMRSEKPVNNTEYTETSLLYSMGEQLDIDPSDLFMVMVRQIAVPGITLTSMDTIFSDEQIEDYKQNGFYAEFTSTPGNETGVDDEKIDIEKVQVGGLYDDEIFYFSINGGSLMSFDVEYVGEILQFAGSYYPSKAAEDIMPYVREDSYDEYILQLTSQPFGLEVYYYGDHKSAENIKQEVAEIILKRIAKDDVKNVIDYLPFEAEDLDIAQRDDNGFYAHIKFDEPQSILVGGTSKECQMITIATRGGYVYFELDNGELMSYDKLDGENITEIKEAIGSQYTNS